MRIAIISAVLLAAVTFVFGYAHLVVDSAADRVAQGVDAVSAKEAILVPGAGLTIDGRPG